MTTLTTAVVGLLEKVRSNDRPVTVVGHSMGTLVATEIAAAAPKLVQRVILVGGPCTSAVRVVKQPSYVFKAPNLVSVLIEVVLGQFRMPQWFRDLVARNSWVRAIMLRPYAHRPRRIATAMVKNLLHGFGSPGNHAVIKEARTYDYDVAARAVRCPIVVVHGDKDLLVPPSDVENLAKIAPLEKLFVLRETGHNPEIERPNTLNKVLLEVLGEQERSFEEERGSHGLKAQSAF
jgi:pimeloyl-ACP methyl ester carboxylesterase